MSLFLWAVRDGWKLRLSRVSRSPLSITAPSLSVSPSVVPVMIYTRSVSARPPPRTSDSWKHRLWCLIRDQLCWGWFSTWLRTARAVWGTRVWSSWSWTSCIFDVVPQEGVPSWTCISTVAGWLFWLFSQKSALMGSISQEKLPDV